MLITLFYGLPKKNLIRPHSKSKRTNDTSEQVKEFMAFTVIERIEDRETYLRRGALGGAGVADFAA